MPALGNKFLDGPVKEAIFQAWVKLFLTLLHITLRVLPLGEIPIPLLTELTEHLNLLKHS